MNGECNGIVHVIEKGDTLYKISRMYGVRLVDLMRENPYLNVYNLQIGDEICVPTIEEDMRDYYLVETGKSIRDITNELDTDIMNLFEDNKELYDLKIPKGMVLRKPRR